MPRQASGQRRVPAPAKAAAPHPGPPWRGWDTYQNIVWSTGTPANPPLWAERVREAGYVAVPAAPEPLPGLGFYVENLIPELAFHHARESRYKADFAGYTATREKQFLVRKPCFDDPAFWEQVTPKLTAAAAHFGRRHPLLYDLRDEPSIGSFTSPMDYCFCPYTLRAFRKWLQTQYRSLADLNAEWETGFRAWEDVVPLTTYEIKDRERSKPESFAPWADHRAYMDYSFAAAIDRMRSILRAADPETPVGIAGVQAPGAFGGYDLWRLSRAVDWVEAYPLGNSPEVAASFLPAGAPLLTSYFGNDAAKLSHTLWERLLSGDRGAIVWDDDPDRVIAKSSPNLQLTARGLLFRGLFESIHPAAAQLLPLRRERDRIAIHYSQASIRAQWMIDSRGDGKTWPRRLASYEVEHSQLIKARAAYLKAVEDLGLAVDFVSYEQLENGELARGQYRALLLPDSVAMSAAECAQVEDFVRRGGVAVGDEAVGSMDEHCRRARPGSRDAFRRAVDRRGPSAIAAAFHKAGIDAPVKASAAGVRIWRFSADGRELVALMQNPAGKQPLRTRVVLPRPMRVRYGQRDLGVVREVDVEVAPSVAALLEVRD